MKVSNGGDVAVAYGGDGGDAPVDGIDVGWYNCKIFDAGDIDPKSGYPMCDKKDPEEEDTHSEDARVDDLLVA